MITELVEFKLTMEPTIDKDDVIDGFVSVVLGLKDTIIPTLEDASKATKELKGIEDTYVFKQTNRILDMKVNTASGMFKKLAAFFTDVVKAKKDIVDVMEKNLPDIILDKKSTVREVAIIKLATDLAIMSNYILDMTYYLLGISKDTYLPKIKQDEIISSLPKFSTMFLLYNEDIKNKVKDVSKLSDNFLPNDYDSGSILEKVVRQISRGVMFPSIKGFIGNPIYHFRLWLEDGKVERYEALKEKKRLIELKLIELKMEQEGDSSPSNLERIKYYEEKISNLEYKIAKYENV